MPLVHADSGNQVIGSYIARTWQHWNGHDM